jgi:hypothetical protein
LFRGEKTSLFWAGLIILSFASVFLFAVIWGMRNYSSSPPLYNSYYYLENSIPVIVGAIVFILIGLVMMKSGARKEKPQ